MAGTTTARTDARSTGLVGIFLWGAAVAVALGVYANSHTPTGEKPYALFFTDTIQLTVWFATAAVVLACLQIFLAMVEYTRTDLGG